MDTKNEKINMDFVFTLFTGITINSCTDNKEVAL